MYRFSLNLIDKRWSQFSTYAEILSSTEKTQKFVPPHKAVTDSDVSTFCRFIRDNGKCLVLTGAGISTESGIPDYRSEGVGLYASSNHKPIVFNDFVNDLKSRQRHWARNFTGWPQFSSKKPNLTHTSLKILEDNNLITGVVTQNVDGLHIKANNRQVIELHGSAYKVICLQCDYSIDRHQFQEVISRLNRLFIVEEVQQLNPDGDVTLPQEVTRDFIIPPCPKCDGLLLKPDIIFFGDNVPKERAEKVRQLVNDSDSLLVLGSSLTVYSSYRIVLQAVQLNKPVLIVNIGPTRADDIATAKLNVRCSEIFDKSLEFIV